MPKTVKRTVKMPTITSRRILNEHEGRSESGARLKDIYVAGIPGFGWIVQNFSGAMFPILDPGLTNCPFEFPKVFEGDGDEERDVTELVKQELAVLEASGEIDSLE